MRSATARASVVLPIPPGPRIVTKRCRESREMSAVTVSSRPVIRVTASGRLCAAMDAIVVASGGWGWFFKAHRGDEIVTPSWNGGDIATAALAIAQGAAQGADLDLQVRLFDEGLRPSSGYELILADYLTRAFDQRGENV